MGEGKGPWMPSKPALPQPGSGCSSQAPSPSWRNWCLVLLTSEVQDGTCGLSLGWPVHHLPGDRLIFLTSTSDGRLLGRKMSKHPDTLHRGSNRARTSFHFPSGQLVCCLQSLACGRSGCRLEEGYPQWLDWKCIRLQLCDGSDGKASACSAGDPGSIPGLGQSPGEGKGNPLQYSCLEISHGLRNLVGYRPLGCKESDMTERLHFKNNLSIRKQIQAEQVKMLGGHHPPGICFHQCSHPVSENEGPMGLVPVPRLQSRHREAIGGSLLLCWEGGGACASTLRGGRHNGYK